MELKNDFEVKEKCYYLEIHTNELPFAINGRKMDDVEKANDKLQDFVRLLEKKFDSIWYIGTDYLGDELYERFMFHHGGFMEISLRGRIKIFFMENKLDKLIESLRFVITKMTSRSRAENILLHIKKGQRIISLKESIFNEVVR